MRSCKSRPSSPHSHCGNRCLAAGAPGACGRVFLYHLLNFVVFLDCFVRCNIRLCLALAFKLLMSLDCCASSSSRYFAVSWTFLWTFVSFWIGANFCPARDVMLVLELFDVVHHLLVHVILLVPSRASDSSHSSFLAGFR